MSGNGNKRNIKEEILQVAGELMLQKGIKETSLKDIANEVGISKGTLYYHYSSKDDIVFEIADKHLTRLTDELNEWVSEMGTNISVEHVLKIVIEKISNLSTRSKLHIYLISEAAMNNVPLKKRFKQKYEEWFNMVEEIFTDQFSQAGIDGRAMAYLVVAVLDGFSMQKLVGINEIPIEDVAKMMVCVRTDQRI